MIWDDDRIATLERLWKTDGLSAAQIADRWGCSRNTVSGKLHRLGLTRSEGQKAKPVRATHAKRVKAAPARPAPSRLGPPPKAQSLVPRDETALRPPRLAPDALWRPLANSAPRPFDERPRSGCKWPVETGGERLACCVPAVRAGYCADHAVIALKPEPPPSANETMRALRRYVS